MKSPTLLIKNKMINSSKCLYDSKHQKTPNKQHLKTNADLSEESNVDFLNLSKSIKHAQRKECSMKTTAESTARKYQLEKNQKHQTILRDTITSPFTPKDSLFESKLSRKISLPESNLDYRKIYPIKDENGGLDSSKNIKNSDTNYNKIMQKIDKKQKLLNELKKLSGAIMFQTMKTVTQAQRFDKKDVNCYKKQEDRLNGSHISKNSKQSQTANFAQFNKVFMENHNKSKNNNSFTQLKPKISIRQTEKSEKNVIKKQDQTIKKCNSTQFIAKKQKIDQRQTAKAKIEIEKNKNKKPLLLKNSHDHQQIKTSDKPLLTKSFIQSSKIVIQNKSDIFEQRQHASLELKFYKQKHSTKDFQIQKSLGEGKFGIVYQVIHKATKTIYALKKMSKQIIKQNGLVSQFIQQIKIQSYCDHENILQLYGFFHDNDYFYLILQYMEEGTLFNQLKKSKSKNLGQLEAAVKLKHLAQGVKYLHIQGIAHRDIKPENIVMSNGVGKLCDFGWAAICTERRKTYCGTFDYVAPQILQGEQYDISVDLWCLGVLAYQLLVGKAPFYHVSRAQTMKKILNIESTALEFPPHLSKISISFIERLIKRNPQQRMTAQAILKHPFLVQVKQKSI